MPLIFAATTAFRRDVKRARKRGKDLGKLQNVVDTLLAEEPLPPNWENHPLSGDWSGCWEIHIEPDWLLIYRIDGQEQELIAYRTGTHSDLFG